MLAPLCEIVLRPSVGITLARVSADVDDAQLRPLTKIFVISRSDLCAYVHTVLRRSPIGRDFHIQFKVKRFIQSTFSGETRLCAKIYHPSGSGLFSPPPQHRPPRRRRFVESGVWEGVRGVIYVVGIAVDLVVDGLHDGYEAVEGFFRFGFGGLDH